MEEARSSSPFTVIEDGKAEEGTEEEKNDMAERAEEETEADMAEDEVEADMAEGDKDAGNLSRPASSFQSMCQRMEDDEQEVPRFISDPVHGSMEVPLVCQAVIHSVQFDRLRSLRQLGCSHYVFPGAKHTRMEHSLGVMHLAGEFLQHLMLKRPGCASKADRLCVMLAGLCHDLGHGPFSHLWELFVAEARPARRWTHEATSLQMLDCIIQENDLMPLFKQHGIGETDIIFIKVSPRSLKPDYSVYELICGPLQQGTDNLEAADSWPFQGRGREKFFLYEFIANKISSVDVDKWDYMMRDAAAMDVKTIFNYKRFINNSDITEVDGRMRLCIRDKEKENVNYLFLDRSRLHKNNYQHKTVKLVDRMILDAFLSADPHLDILGRDAEGGIVRLSEACDNVHNFCKLSDDFLLKSIQFSRGPELAEARRLVHRIATRNLYKLVGEVTNSSQGGVSVSRADCEKDLNELLRQELEKGVPMNLKQGDIVVTRKRIHFGCGSENPVEKVIFFDKRNRPIAVSSSELDLTPAVTSSESLLVMCRRDQADAIAIQEARDLFLRWREERKTQ